VTAGGGCLFWRLFAAAARRSGHANLNDTSCRHIERRQSLLGLLPPLRMPAAAISTPNAAASFCLMLLPRRCPFHRFYRALLCSAARRLRSAHCCGSTPLANAALGVFLPRCCSARCLCCWRKTATRRIFAFRCLCACVHGGKTNLAYPYLLATLTGARRDGSAFSCARLRHRAWRGLRYHWLVCGRDDSFVLPGAPASGTGVHFASGQGGSARDMALWLPATAAFGRLLRRLRPLLAHGHQHLRAVPPFSAATGFLLPLPACARLPLPRYRSSPSRICCFLPVYRQGSSSMPWTTVQWMNETGLCASGVADVDRRFSIFCRRYRLTLWRDGGGRGRMAQRVDELCFLALRAAAVLQRGGVNGAPHLHHHARTPLQHTCHACRRALPARLTTPAAVSQTFSTYIGVTAWRSNMALGRTYGATFYSLDGFILCTRRT